MNIMNPIPATTDAWDKTFAKSDKVNHRKVSFANRIGITLVADFYTPKGATGPLPALVVGGPYGAVKEQAAGFYAQTMAERGFATVAFDPSFNGESGGNPRHISSPEIFCEDFSAAVDFLGLRDEVDRERIGAIGVCGSGGFVLSAAQFDPRMKAVATSAMWDMGRGVRQGLNDVVTEEQRREILATAAQMRWDQYGQDDLGIVPGTPLEITEETDAVGREFYSYYRNPKRGQHPRSLTGFSFTSLPAMMRFRPFNHLDAISPRPVLLITGDNAHSRYFSEDAYKAASEPKELVVVPDAIHVDLYDQADKIPFDKLQAFFAEHL